MAELQKTELRFQGDGLCRPTDEVHVLQAGNGLQRVDREPALDQGLIVAHAGYLAAGLGERLDYGPQARSLNGDLNVDPVLGKAQREAWARRRAS